MPLTPSGPLSLALHAMRRTVASSATFQALTGAASEALALARVLIPETIDEEASAGVLLYPRPRVIVSHLEFSRRFRGQGGASRDQNGFLVSIELTVPATDSGDTIEGNKTNEITYISNKLGAILDEIETAVFTGSGPNGNYAAIGELTLASEIDDMLLERDTVEEHFYAADFIARCE